MSRTKSCNYARSALGAGEILGGDDIHYDWGTPPQSPESRRFLRRHAAKARRRNDRQVIRDGTKLTASQACVLGALQFLTA